MTEQVTIELDESVVAQARELARRRGNLWKR